MQIHFCTSPQTQGGAELGLCEELKNCGGKGHCRKHLYRIA